MASPHDLIPAICALLFPIFSIIITKKNPDSPNSGSSTLLIIYTPKEKARQLPCLAFSHFYFIFSHSD